ncbi:fungal specific transcription factor domain-containing protein [Aspergillus puulaauensis]|uniref:Xylanolytic transcriptional activator regulatory domain-containing protein n=1 Tax=Aspergillus puulaauensis TaxID=1220207 RepID=A0A7R7XXG9_9EURO|nr:uncharacterized protein APUU_71095S [Aspergillus puulaauensis]BCS29525.1 hypothetical protein APUU_71095S [Aspergillus puulaauensis]
MTDRPNPRKRVSLACEQCRAKRTRVGSTVMPASEADADADNSVTEDSPNVAHVCRRTVPANTPAAKINESTSPGELFLTLANSDRPPSKRYVQSLQAHIAVLERQLVELGGKVSRLETGRENAATADGEPNSPPNNLVETKSSDLRDPIEELTQRAGRLNIGEDGQLRYFGAQSNYHLLHGPIYNETTRPIQEFQEIGLATAGLLCRAVDVPQGLQDHLLGLYWRWQNPWLYMIHKGSFMSDYRNGGRGKFCSPVLLFAIFALSSRYSDRVEVRSDPEDPHSAGNRFAEQAKILLQHECEAPTTTTVQAASLLSLRWMSENKESLGWLYIGMATRMAYNLGLNLDCASWVAAGMISEQDAEVRRITWWGCYKLDKLYCIGLGRPGTTRLSDITCQKPKLEPEVEFEPWLPEGKQDDSMLGAHTRTITAMRYSCDHLSMISEALETIYAPGHRVSEPEAEKIVARADVAFNTFYNSLPSHLRLPSSPRTPSCPHIYQLHIQFHVLQIQLHRPLIRHRHVPSQEVEEADTHLEACRKSATTISRILKTYQVHYTLRLTPVVTVVNTFSAAVIHLMGAASPDEEIRRSAQRCLRICILALEQMALAWMWSRRALRAVRLLAREWLITDPTLLSSREHEDDGNGNGDGNMRSQTPSKEIEDTSMSACNGAPPTPSLQPLEPAPQYWTLGGSTDTGLDMPFQGASGVQPRDLSFCDFGDFSDPTYLGLDLNDTDWLASLNAVEGLGGGFDSSAQADPWVTSALSQYPFQDQWVGIPEALWPVQDGV